MSVSKSTRPRLTEAEIKEIRENKPKFRRLNRAVLLGMRERQTTIVKNRRGEEYEIELRPIPDPVLFNLGEKYDLADMKTEAQLQAELDATIKKFGPDSPEAKKKIEDNAKKLAEDRDKQLKMMPEAIAASIVPAPGEPAWTGLELEELFDIRTRAGLFSVISKISGLSGPDVQVMEKFRTEPPKPHA